MVTLADEGITEENAEDGQSFAENAALKARGYASLRGFLTLADDSGLEVDTLNGEPGIYSARYGGETSDEGRIRRLLREMEGVPWEKRTARFKCVIAIASNTGLATCTGQCRGVITFESRGTEGFGYDPVFYVPELGKSMAELSFQAKNRMSHRSRAATKARQILRNILKAPSP